MKLRKSLIHKCSVIFKEEQGSNVGLEKVQRVSQANIDPLRQLIRTQGVSAALHRAVPARLWTSEAMMEQVNAARDEKERKEREATEKRERKAKEKEAREQKKAADRAAIEARKAEKAAQRAAKEAEKQAAKEARAAKAATRKATAAAPKKTKKRARDTSPGSVAAEEPHLDAARSSRKRQPTLRALQAREVMESSEDETVISSDEEEAQDKENSSGSAGVSAQHRPGLADITNRPR